MKVLILTLILSVPILADVFNPSVIPQSTSPSGACSNGSALIHNYVDNTVWGCKAGTWTEIAGGGGGGSSTGPVNAIQAADGSGGFLNTGCTGSSASILCTNGFSTGGPFAAGGLWQACSGVTTPASNNFTLFFDSANSGATSYKNSAGTCSAVGGSSMVYPGAGVSVSTGGAWGTSLTAPVGSTALAGIQTHNIFATDQSITGTLIPYYIADVNSTVFVDLTNHTVQVAPFGTNPTIVPLTVKGSPGQTANLTEYKDSTGAVVASVSATGVGTFPAVYGGTAAGSSLTLNSTSNGSPSGDSILISASNIYFAGPSGPVNMNAGPSGGGYFDFTTQGSSGCYELATYGFYPANGCVSSSSLGGPSNMWKALYTGYSVGLASAPVGACSPNGAWQFTQDGHASVCLAAVWVLKI